MRVRTRLVHSPDASFPAVTICNYNPIKKSLLHLNPRIEALVQAWTNRKLHAMTSPAPQKRQKRNSSMQTRVFVAIQNVGYQPVLQSFSWLDLPLCSDLSPPPICQSPFFIRRRPFTHLSCFWIGFSDLLNLNRVSVP